MKNRIAKIIVDFFVVMGMFFVIALISYWIKASSVFSCVIICMGIVFTTWLCYKALFDE